MHQDGERWRRAFEQHALPLFLAALMAIWLLLVLIWPVAFWQTHDDYVYLSLAHALNLEMRLRDGVHYYDCGLSTHPGVPFYVVSWLCLRVAAFLTGHRDSVAYVLTEPATFFLATRIAAGSITLAAIAGGWRIFAPLTAGMRVLVLSSFFASDPHSLIYGLTFLGNETFALPLAVLLFWSANKVLAASKERLSPWVWVGVVAALGYLVKLLYLDMIAGAVALACMRTIRLSALAGSKLAFAAARLVMILGSFFALSVGVLVIFLGWTQLLVLTHQHLIIATHTRIYGGGDAQIFSLQVMRDSLASLASVSPLPFVVAAAAGCLSYFIYREWRSATLSDGAALWYAMAIAALGAASFAVLKHYQPYYVTAVAALLPFVWKPLLEKGGLAKVAALCILAGGVFTGWAAVGKFSELSRAAARMQADEAAIAAMPLGNGEARLWTYRVPSKYFAKEFIRQCAGALPLPKSPEDTVGREFSSYANQVRHYRYVVFDRDFFPNSDALRRSVAGGERREPNGMVVSIGVGAVFRELEATIIVELPPR